MMGRGGGGGTQDLSKNALRADFSPIASRLNTFSRVLSSTRLSIVGMDIVELALKKLLSCLLFIVSV